jgi:D-galactonate transporter
VTLRFTDFSLYGKLARRLIPFLFILYLVAFIDRVNVGFAKLQMMSDLGLNEADYGVGAGIFFLGYFLLEVPSNFMLHRVGARLWIARIVLLWGFISMAMALVQSKSSFYLLRLLLGMGEAGFFPGIILYLTYWFPARHRARTTALFMMALAVSGILGGPVSGWIMQSLDGRWDLRGWQWLFLLEGAPAVVLGCLCLLVLDDSPAQAAWLSSEEKRTIGQDLELDRQRNAGQELHHRFRNGIRDRRLWVLAVVYMLLSVGIYGVSFWLPQIIHDLGTGGFLVTGLLSAIPYSFAAVAMVWISHCSDVRQERRWHIALSALAGTAGLVISAGFLHSAIPALAGLTLATLGIFAALAVFWSLPTAFLTGSAAAGGIALINSIAALGGYLGPVVIGWVRQETGSVESGLYVIAGALVLAAFMVILGLQVPPRSSA